eukprot:scaffold13045_cov266-Ochromonas_danica.AAC.2
MTREWPEGETSTSAGRGRAGSAAAGDAEDCRAALTRSAPMPLRKGEPRRRCAGRLKLIEEEPSLR